MTKRSVSKTHEEMARGSADKPAEPRFLTIGEVLRPHGVRGEMRIRAITELPQRFTWLKTVYMGKNPQTAVALTVETARLHQGFALLKCDGIDDRDAVDLLRGHFLYVPEADAIPLEEGEYYLYQLEGLTVVTDDGQTLGKLVDVLETGANNVFVVETDKGQLLLPDIKDVILDIDFENGRMTVHLLEGLLP